MMMIVTATKIKHGRRIITHIDYFDHNGSQPVGISNFDLRIRFVGVGFCMCFRLATLPTSSKGMLADRVCLANWCQPTGSRAVFRFLIRS